jgi:hypothetical protein
MTREEVINWMNQTAVETGLKLDKEDAMRGPRYHLYETFKSKSTWDHRRDVLWCTFYEDDSATFHYPHDFVFDIDGNLRDYQSSYQHGFRDCKDVNLMLLLEYRKEIDKSLGDIARARKETKIAKLYAEGHSGIK